TFAAGWRPPAAGRTRLRAVAAQGASASSLSPEIAVTVYRSALATYYGPGFYGRRTACGHRMSRRLLGVAHKTLPCGTQVAVRYGAASLVVPVVDRGPYRRGTSYDLTSATATALGFHGLARIGAVALPELPRVRVRVAPARAAARQPSR
ncbi:MAG: septal ring lytic transglycosylase RlpA family protein, partial [Actinomycetota bacterium]|nr:septal ring lytic transglycosylase RlpA family protein [Actinomycetota bacterium]